MRDDPWFVPVYSQVQQFQFKRIIFYGKYQFGFDLIKEFFALHCRILMTTVKF